MAMISDHREAAHVWLFHHKETGAILLRRRIAFTPTAQVRLLEVGCMGRGDVIAARARDLRGQGEGAAGCYR